MGFIKSFFRGVKYGAETKLNSIEVIEEVPCEVVTYDAPQSLKLAPHIFDQFKTSGKYVTIRKGRRDIKLGVLDFECTSGTRGRTVEVNKVSYMRLIDVSDKDLKADNFANFEALLETMQSFYPDISVKDEVTVIYFL